MGEVIVTNPAIKARAYTLAHSLPVVGGVLQAREIAAWARLTSFALVNGVPILSFLGTGTTIFPTIFSKIVKRCTAMVCVPFLPGFGGRNYDFCGF